MTVSTIVEQVVINKQSFLNSKQRINIFEIDNKRFVAKIVPKEKAAIELKNAQECSRILADKTNIKPLVPNIQMLNSESSVLITPYLGLTLSEKIQSSTISRFTLNDLFTLIDTMLSHRLCWSGLVPRNLFVNDKSNKVLAIDFEELEILNNAKHLSTLILLKWSLGWSGFIANIHSTRDLYNEISTFLINKGFSISDEVLLPLDEFEVFYRDLSGCSDVGFVRNFCNKLTLETENNLQTEDINLMRLPFEVGHKVEDILAKYSLDLSFLYSCCVKNIRSNSEKKYKDFLITLTNYLVQNSDPYEQACFIWYTIDEALRNNHDEGLSLQKLHSLYKKIYNKSGLDISTERSTLVENILNRLLFFIKQLPIEIPQLILRGSLAHGVLSTNSDVDFEFSDKEHPNGHLVLEELYSSLCHLFNIKCEGSGSRPLEKDLVSIDMSSLSRDLHEWMEIRILMQDNKKNLWCHNLFATDKSFWLKPSQYENSNFAKLTPKILFFQVRSLIQRLGYKNGYYRSKLQDILVFLPNELTSVLCDFLEESISLYDSKSHQMIKMKLLAKNISTLAREHNIPTIIYGELNNDC